MQIAFSVNKLSTNRFSLANVIKIYILLYPICDIIYTITENIGFSLPININQLIRGIGLILFFGQIKEYKNFIKVVLLTIWAILSFFIMLQEGYSTNVVTDFAFLLKYIQNFVLYYSFCHLYKTLILTIDDVVNALIASSYIVIISILLSYVGFGSESYISSSRFGVKGLFSIQSTITIYLLMVLPLYYYKVKRMFSTGMVFCVLALLSIGTRAGVFGTLLICTFLSIYDMRLNPQKNKMIKYFILFGFTLTIGVQAMVSYITYLMELYKTHSYYYNLTAFLLSNRNDQVGAMKNGIKMLPVAVRNIGLIFGYGYSGAASIMSHTYRHAAIERDFHGMFYYFGAVSFVLLSISLVKVFSRAIKAFSIAYRENISGDVMISLALIAGIFYAYLAGHVFYEAMNALPFWALAAFQLVHCESNNKKVPVKIVLSKTKKYKTLKKRI